MKEYISDNGIELTLTPSQASTGVELEKLPSMGTITNSSKAAVSVSAGTITEDMLSEDEKKIVDEFAKQIDISNIEQMVQYGSGAQKNISDFSIDVLKQVKTMDLGEVGASLKELTVALEVTTEPEKKGISGLFQKSKRSIQSLLANYAKAETNVDKIEADLQKHQSILRKDISMYQQMFELNNKYYKELTMYIIAGKKVLDQAINNQLVEYKNIAQQTNTQEDAQIYRDFEDQCNRFAKKLNDLEVTRVIAIQLAPQIRLLQNNDRELFDKIQSSLSNTIPLWRNQLVLSLGIEHSKRATDAQRILSYKTNELLLKNAETLKTASIEAAKESERPIVETEVLKKCNDSLITSITEVVRIHEQGKDKRTQAHTELLKIECELKEALINAGKG